MIKILYLSPCSKINGPIPKIDSILIKSLENSNCKITKCEWGRHSDNETLVKKIIGRFGDLVKIRHKARQITPDIIYIVSTLDERALTRDIPLLLAFKFSKIKKIIMMHGSKTVPLYVPGHNLYKIFTRYLINSSDAILLLSNDEINEWRSFEPRGNYYKVDNPFIPQITSLPSINYASVSIVPIFLFVGRLIKEKGIFDLIEAMPLILKHTTCQLLIAGSGKEIGNLKSVIKTKKLENNVTILGYQSPENLSSLYKCASIFILPSYSEGFPTVIAEAMSNGLPIVTTSIRGIKDHLIDGVNAIFVDIKDPLGIATAVNKLLDDDNLAKKIGEANILKVKNFSPENVTPQYLAVFNEVLKI